ncbi:MFS transporter [Spiractinospora alimapuensis]|uniref:MFS transporter n=1 Tax=Spiractinospora alimapuensis TaxID=2820884 RepID=UPI001F4589EC|nr:MFS transporter [Spiractinospora alimapuensis]QVQ52101.1 MFS transporter [Spiractinospora alimapuensis]
MPRSVYALALGVFTVVTSEFAVAGLMPQLAVGLETTVSEIGYLVAVFALAMAVGGPPIAGAMLRLSGRTSLLILLGGFILGNLVAAVATDYWVMVLARLVTGASSGAFFGVAVTLAGTLVPVGQRVRAIGTTMQGLMLGTTLGLPFATWLGGQWGWRWAFGAIVLLAVSVALVILRLVPRVATNAGGSMRGELGVFRSVRLWGTLTTSTLVIAATFAAFSYFTPVLNDVTGMPLSSVPWLLMMYGGATVLGNAVVARLASGNPLLVLAAGISLNAAFLTVFAVAAGTPWLAIPAMMGIGLVGVTMNPALVNRVHRGERRNARQHRARIHDHPWRDARVHGGRSRHRGRRPAGSVVDRCGPGGPRARHAHPGPAPPRRRYRPRAGVHRRQRTPRRRRGGSRALTATGPWRGRGPTGRSVTGPV